MAKRRRGFPSETNVKRGAQSVGDEGKILEERLGREDPCPCGSGHRFQAMLPPHGPLRRRSSRGVLSATEVRPNSRSSPHRGWGPRIDRSGRCARRRPEATAGGGPSARERSRTPRPSRT
ncbi:MAG: hypothetical protein EOP88_21535 [Verrucomicrobiaceae bacterium]|nr:MAG: hypothetical protein EOP88_21535 [Verrucomicrobiaceae bacterium]